MERSNTKGNTMEITIVKETLSDGSAAHNMVIGDEDNCISLSCLDLGSAERVEKCLRDNTVEFATDTISEKEIGHGLYRIHWKCDAGGGTSLAAIGSYSDGRRWFAPTNWTTSDGTQWHLSTYLVDIGWLEKLV